MISGPCQGESLYGNDIIAFEDSVPLVGYWYSYPFKQIQGNVFNTVSCKNGFDYYYTTGTATVADFWVDRTDPDHPWARWAAPFGELG